MSAPENTAYHDDEWGRPITDEVRIYEKPTGDKTMTFLVTENEYRNQDGELVLTARMNLIHRG